MDDEKDYIKLAEKYFTYDERSEYFRLTASAAAMISIAKDVRRIADKVDEIITNQGLIKVNLYRGE